MRIEPVASVLLPCFKRIFAPEIDSDVLAVKVNVALPWTIDHLKLGVYQDGGRQLARFSQDGQNYDTVGYSQRFRCFSCKS
jgi:hypothetical protein